MTDNDRSLSAIALVCSLKRSPAESSSALMAEHVFEQLREAGVKTEALRSGQYPPYQSGSFSSTVEVSLERAELWRKEQP